MKTRTFIISILAFVIATQLLSAQGTLYISNLGQTPVGSLAVGSDSWIAQEFITGNNSGGYVLNSIELLMNVSSGSPAGFSISVYSKTGDPHSGRSGDSPSASIGDLNGSAKPSTGGLFAYTSGDLFLSSHTSYFVVVTAATPVATGSYVWSAANSFTDDPNTLWTIDDEYYSSADGASWTDVIRQDVFQLGIYATPIPEPQIGPLLGLGLFCLGFLSRQRK